MDERTEAEKAEDKTRSVRELERIRESMILTLASEIPIALIVAIVVLNTVVSVWSWKVVVLVILMLVLIGEVINKRRIRKLEKKNWELEDELQILQAFGKI